MSNCEGWLQDQPAPKKGQLALAAIHRGLPYQGDRLNSTAGPPARDCETLNEIVGSHVVSAGRDVDADLPTADFPHRLRQQGHSDFWFLRWLVLSNRKSRPASRRKCSWGP